MVSFLVKYLLLIFMFLSVQGHARLKTFEVQGPKKEIFTFQEVCQSKGLKHNVLISPYNYVVLDCMGTKVNVMDFCYDKFQNDYQFMRGFIHKKMNRVICQKGSSVFLEISCDGQDQPLCQSPNQACTKLKQKVARNLSIYRSFVVEEETMKSRLSCLFAATKPVKDDYVPEFLNHRLQGLKKVQVEPEERILDSIY